MVIKVDKSEEFKKSGKKLISEYDAEKWLDKIEKNDERELFEMKRKREYLNEWTKFRKDGQIIAAYCCVNAYIPNI